MWEEEERPWLAAASAHPDPGAVFARYAQLRAVDKGEVIDDTTEEGREKAIKHLLKLRAEVRAQFPLN